MPQLELDVYARVSRIGDERQRSPEGQVIDCRARIEERGDRVGQVFVDRGKSAWNPKVKRLEFGLLMERLESGAADGVVVFDLARFSRRPIEGERLIVAAERGLVVLDSEGEYDLLSASGRKHFRDQLAAAAYESDRLSTRVKRGKRLKAGKGETNGTHRPFGFEPDRMTVRESEAAIIREIADRILAGDARDTQDALARELTARGIRTATGREWSSQSLRQTMTSPHINGWVTHRGEKIKQSRPAILDDITAGRLTALYAARRRGRPISTRYLLSGIARCGRCGKPLVGRPRANMRPYDDGSVRRQYWCQYRPAYGGCQGISVDQRALDGRVRDMTVGILADPRHAAAVAAAAAEHADQAAELDRQIAELDELAVALSTRLGRREISLARYDAAVGPLDAELAELRGRREALGAGPEPPPDAAATAESLQVWQRRWGAAVVGERRALIRQALGGRRLVVLPLDRHAPRQFDPARVQILP